VLFDVAAVLNGIDGIEVQMRAASAADVEEDDDVGYVAWAAYLMELWTTSDRYYHPPTRLVGQDLGGGQALLTWKLPPDRFDRYRVALRRDAGAVPPTWTTGTAVTLPSLLPATFTDSPGAGTWSYSLFATYDEGHEAPAADQQVSTPDTIAGLVVT
jgi:hypothetical protein